MFYDTVVRPDLLSKMQYKNVHMVPRVEQMTVSISTHMKASGADNPIPAAFILELLTGQQPVFTRIRRANAKYKVRTGVLEGAVVRLSGDNMYHFMDRLITQALPRVTDFQGLKSSSFDGRGNYVLGIADWSYFLEVESQHNNLQNFGLQYAPGLGIKVLTSARSDDEARLLLSGLRFPLKTGK